MAQYQIPASHLKKLKKDELTDHIKLLYSYIGNLEKENEELNEENEELKQEHSHSELFWDVSVSLKQHIDDYGTHKEGEIISAIEKLKEKITCLESDSHNEVSMAEYDELKEENEELSARIELWENKENTD